MIKKKFGGVVKELNREEQKKIWGGGCWCKGCQCGDYGRMDTGFAWSAALGLIIQYPPR